MYLISISDLETSGLSLLHAQESYLDEMKNPESGMVNGGFGGFLTILPPNTQPIPVPCISAPADRPL